MRLGVLDIGSNTVHLVVVDAHPGGTPLPAHDDKTTVSLARYLQDDESISDEGVQRYKSALLQAREQADELGADELLAFATSALREATNGPEVIEMLRSETGVDLEVLSGDAEARLTFLAARRWFGWSAGRLLALDIGGGSLEIVIGQDEDPDYAESLPFGAGRTMREFLPQHPAEPSAYKSLNRRLIQGLSKTRRELSRFGAPDMVVGSSKTFRMLARATEGEYTSSLPRATRVLTLSALDDLVDRLKVMPVADRVKLNGVKVERADQVLAGALVAQATMRALEVEALTICPWALREGIILRRLDMIQMPEIDGVATPRAMGFSGGAGKCAGGAGAPVTGSVAQALRLDTEIHLPK